MRGGISTLWQVERAGREPSLILVICCETQGNFQERSCIDRQSNLKIEAVETAGTEFVRRACASALRVCDEPQSSP